MRMFLNMVLCVLAAAVLLAAIHTTADAQSINGAFHGTVTDPLGAVVAGAKVEVKNLASGEVRQATTNEDGFYTITGLAPGHYSESASKSGFSITVRPDVQLEVSQDLEVNNRLELGSNTTTVKVEATPQMLETASSTLGHEIGSKAAVDLPLNGRQFAQLILLAPGAAPVQGSQQNTYMIPFGAGGLSPGVNGQLGNQNVFTIDGIIDSHPFIQSFEVSPPPDAIQEFKTQNHIADAQFSISSGANVNVVTKSGSNAFHGDVWEFHRNRTLNAANFFDNFAGRPKPAYVQNQFGFTLGGPVVLPFHDGRKKNTHFFGYYEGFRSTQGFSLLANVPTQAELNGNFADLLTNTQATANGQPVFDAAGRPVMAGQLYNPYSTRTVSGQLVRDPIPGNDITSVMPLNAGASTWLKSLYYPANFGPGGNQFPNFSIVSKQFVTNNQFGIGADHTFRNNDTAFVHYFYSKPDQRFPNFVRYGTLVNENHARLLASSYTHLFSPTLLATLHYGWTGVLFGLISDPAPQSVIDAFNGQNFVARYLGTPYAPEISIGPRFGGASCPTCFGVHQAGIPQGPDYMHQFNFDIQKVKGAHIISTGLLYYQMHAFDDGVRSSVGFDQFPTSALANGNSNIPSTGDGLASMLMDLPSSYGTIAGVSGADIKTFWLGGYLQDKWQVTRKLNVQFGLRWDFQAPPHFKDNIYAAWNVNCSYGNYTTPQAVQAIEQQCLLVAFPHVEQATAANPFPASFPQPNTRTSIWQPKYNGWQPRLGIAYRVTPKLVIRTGFNVFDDHNAFVKEMQNPRGSPPAGYSPSASNLNRQVPSVFTDALPSIATLKASAQLAITRSADVRNFIPYVMQWNFGVQEQMTQDMSLEVEYVGSTSRHLWGTIAYNQPLPGTLGPNALLNGKPFSFFPVIAGDTNIFSANYNALQLSLRKRYSNGLMFIASYTYSHCLNYVGGEFDVRPQNTYNMTLDYGGCQANIPQIFSFSPVYELPFGKGARFASGAGRLAKALIGGWSISDITSIHSGVPFSASLAFDNANVGTSSGARANFVSGCNLIPSGFSQNAAHWYNPACFVVPPQYTFGLTSRDAYRGPGFVNFDIAVLKNFRITETSALQIRVESFNTFNHTNFKNPASNVATPTFMQITAAYDPREIQFGAKFTF